jgi:predicted DNA-binding protein with PD1-like motif
MATIHKLSEGASLVDEIVRIVKVEKIKAAIVDGIGTVNELKLAPSEVGTKKHELREFKEQMEVTGLLGNVRIKNGKPAVHVHATFGRRDMTVIGGHVVFARVSPMFELMITPTTDKEPQSLD